MKDLKTILIAGLIVTVIALILLRGCGNPQSAPDSIDIELIYDSLERVIISNIPEQVPDTIRGKDVIKWIEPDVVVDTVWSEGQAYVMEVPTKIDTNAIIEHWKLEALTYQDTIEDDTLRAFVDDTIYQNKIVGRSFRYQLLMPIASTTNITKKNVFQAHAIFTSGIRSDFDSIYRLSVGAGMLLEFKTGTGVGPKYSYTLGHPAPHQVEVMITQRISLRSNRQRERSPLSAASILLN